MSDATRKRIPAQFPWVTPFNCEGCGDCVNKCPVHALDMTATNIDGVYVPWMKDTAKCVGCGLCAQTCVMAGIVMTTFTDRAIERFENTTPTINRD